MDIPSDNFSGRNLILGSFEDDANKQNSGVPILMFFFSLVFFFSFSDRFLSSLCRRSLKGEEWNCKWQKKKNTEKKNLQSEYQPIPK